MIKLNYQRYIFLTVLKSEYSRLKYTVMLTSRANCMTTLVKLDPTKSRPKTQINLYVVGIEFYFNPNNEGIQLLKC